MFADTDLLWFVLPSEANDLLSGKLQLPLLDKSVFTPKVFGASCSGKTPLVDATTGLVVHKG